MSRHGANRMADIVVIDDDLDCADVLGEILRADGHVVRVGYNGEEGLQLVHERCPEVAVLDVEMPILDGPAMAYQMFVRDCGLERIPIVLLSGAPNLREVATSVGTPYFLAKPYRQRLVIALVRRAVSERTAPLPPERPT